MAVDNTKLSANLGAYYREHRDTIHTDIVFGLQEQLIEQGIELMDGVADEVPLVNMDVEDVMQNGGDSRDWNPTEDAVKLDNRMMKVRPAKVDLEIDPARFERMWLTYLRTSKGKLTMKNFPLYEFIWMKLKERINDNIGQSLWRSVFLPNAPTKNWATVHDGWNKKLTEDVALGNIVPVTTGAISKSTVLEDIESVFDGFGETNKSKPGICHLTSEVYTWYTRLTETQAGRGMSFTELSEGNLYIRGSKTKIVNNPYLLPISGIQPIVITKANNLVYATDSQDEANKFDFQPNKRIIDVMGDWKIGVNYYSANSKYKSIVTNDAYA